MQIALFEDDRDSEAFIEPASVWQKSDMSSRVVFCFFSEITESLADRPDARVIAELQWAHGGHPVYEIEHRGQRLCVVHAGVGAPLAAGLLEEVIALGGREIVAVGGAGALVPDLALGHPIVVGSAVRDEGTSFHYLPPGRVVEADASDVAAAVATLDAAAVPYVVGRSWTTDGVYREARSRVERRVRVDGCIAVEMEAAALLAVAKFRGARLVSLLYAGDSLAGEEWDHRGWHSQYDVRESLFWLAADIALALPSVE